jgi:hypothetical protein
MSDVGRVERDFFTEWNSSLDLMCLSSVMASSSARPLTLFCWILDMSDRAFPVDTKDSRTVGHLKEAIVKKKPMVFANVDPNQLTLWKVCDFSLSIERVDYITIQESVPIDKKLKNPVTRLQFTNEDALLEADSLLDLFPSPEPTKKTLHMIIRAPSIISRAVGKC